jgi:NAD(P)-dependent dehydrogenase (short-subunit alcohol dehydrogenase family)
MSSKLQGKIALITGGGSGIGLATAKTFAAEGAKVIIVGRRKAELASAAQSLGDNTTALMADITDLASLDWLFAEVKTRFGRLDIVFANAGVLHIGELATITEKDYHRVLDTNLKGTLFTVQKALPLLAEGASVILNAAAIASKGVRGLALNAAAKSAVRSLARTLTAELADRHIRVNALSPGSIATPILDAARISLDDANSITKGGAPIPMGRVGSAEELAAAVLFLASDESSYITGIDLAVDGGQAQV